MLRVQRQTVTVGGVAAVCLSVAVGGLVYIQKQEMHNQNIQTNQSCTHGEGAMLEAGGGRGAGTAAALVR